MYPEQFWDNPTGRLPMLEQLTMTPELHSFTWNR
jgi:hypothetical protein